MRGASPVVGLDIGTTAAKALAVAADGSVGERRERTYGRQADAETIVAAALELAGDGPVALSSAMHSLIGLDARDRPVTPLLRWSDPPVSVAPPEHLHARTGMPSRPWTPIARLMALRAEGVRAARWAGIKELVVHRLTGEWVMDHSIASGTGLMALDTLDWDPEALDVAGVTPEQLPRLVPVTERLGDLVVGAGDGPLANLGLGAVGPGVAACSIGTSAAMRMTVPEPRVAAHGFCYALTPGRWVVGTALSNGGAVLDWLARTLNRPVDELLALAQDADALPHFAPHLLGEREHDRPAALTGLRFAHGPGEIVRAALAGVCRELRAALDALPGDVREVRATGGFARSPLFKQLLADALAMPVGFTATREGSAYGAALLALGVEDPAVAIVETITPR